MPIYHKTFLFVTFSIFNPIHVQKRPLRINKGSNPIGQTTLKQKLQNAGRGGLVAYGFLNAAYYCTVTFITYMYYLKDDALRVPSHLGFGEKLSIAASLMGKIIAIVWAGSQVTKALRITAAIALAPVGERALNRFGGERKFGALCRCLLGFTFIFYACLIANTAFKPANFMAAKISMVKNAFLPV